jgi:hypothetical protein
MRISVAAMARANGLANFNKIRNSCPTSQANIWSVDVNGDRFAITPAHVALFAKDNVWHLASFLEDLYNLNWSIPFSYAVRPSPQNDICWAHLPPDDTSEALELDDTPITEPQSVDVVFRQPYDIYGRWVGSNSTLGATQATLYKSPSDLLVGSIDFGFRGMSGAATITSESKLIGIFVKRASLIQMKKPTTPSVIPIAYTDATTPFERYVCDELRYLGDWI